MIYFNLKYPENRPYVHEESHVLSLMFRKQSIQNRRHNIKILLMHVKLSWAVRKIRV